MQSQILLKDVAKKKKKKKKRTPPQKKPEIIWIDKE